MRTRTLLIALLLCGCAAKKPVKMMDVSGARAAPDAGSPPPARASSEPAPAPALASESDDGPASPDWLPAPPAELVFATRLARETSALKPFDFSSRDGRYTGRALAAQAPHVEPAKPKQVPRLVIPIGAEYPIICALQGAQMQPARWLQLMLANQATKRRLASVQLVSIRAVAQAPLMSFDLFTEPLDARADSSVASGARAPAGVAPGGAGAASAGADSPDGGAGNVEVVDEVALAKKSVDEVKIAFVARPWASLICTHEGPGYRRTFERVVESVAASVNDREAKKPPAPPLIALDLVRSEGKLVGYVLTRKLPQRSDGAHDELVSAPRFDHDEQGKLVVSAVESRERRARNDELRHGDYLVTREAVTSSVALEEEPDGSYSVTGAPEEKGLAGSLGTLKGAKGLRRPTAEQLAAIASGAQAELVFDDYSPLQPLQLRLLRVKRGGAPGKLVVGSSVGEDQHWTVDAAGAVQKIEQRGADGAPETIERLAAWTTP